MTFFEHDGTVFDLDRDYIDVTGVVWAWSSMWTADGEPLMGSRVEGGKFGANEPLRPLPDVYHDHGPLIPRPQPTPAALYRRVLLQEAS